MRHHLPHALGLGGGILPLVVPLIGKQFDGKGASGEILEELQICVDKGDLDWRACRVIGYRILLDRLGGRMIRAMRDVRSGHLRARYNDH